MSIIDGLAQGLLPASYKGVPFAVLSNDTGGGRRQVVHQYPGRDIPWTEDMGREARSFRFRGFLVANDRVYAGGPVALQRALLLAVLEQAGPGLMTHPSLGILSVSVRRFSLGEDRAAATYSDVDIEFVESGKRTYPTILSSSSGLLTAANLAKLAIAVDIVRAIVLATSAMGSRNDMAATSRQWTAQTLALGGDATALTSLASHLDGNFGRFAGGGNVGFDGTTYSSDASATIADLASAASTQRAAIGRAAETVAQAIDGLTVTTVEADVVQAAALLVDALVAACADPSDALRLLLRLLAFAPLGPEAGSALGRAINNLFRRLVAIALGGVVAVYQPSSQDDASARMRQVAAALDDQITVAGDEGADDTFQTLRALRVAVVNDLRARGASLAPIRRFTTSRPLPALALAQRLYRDAERQDQLVRQVSTVHPLFMPASFAALAA